MDGSFQNRPQVILHITLKGNRLHYVLDDAENLMYEGAVEFQGDESNGSAFGYNANGGLITDTGKGIMHIDYDDNNYPRRIQFANGNVTEYVYTATGEKLRAVHYTAVPNIEVGSGETHELTTAEILFKDSTDYHGSLIMENGVPAQYLFDGGYCKLTDGSGNANISYHYYDRDHLGNIRGVIDEAGTVEQITNYYPFGAPYSDATTTNPTFQRYKYNGKELELMHGLKWYDYGARWYDPLLVNWNRPDPSHKDYYPWSPYVYCGDNPVNAVDPDGRIIIPVHHTSSGKSYYKSPSQFKKAMIAFGKTTFGHKILADFTPKGQTIFGVRGNGRYSQYEFYLNEFDYSGQEQGASLFNGKERVDAQTQLKYDGQELYFSIIFDIQRSEYDLTETINHEFSLHLSNYEEIIKAYEQNNDYNDALKLWNSESEDMQHRDFLKTKMNLKGSSNYHKTAEELIKNNSKLKTIFDNQLKFYEKLYK